MGDLIAHVGHLPTRQLPVEPQDRRVIAEQPSGRLADHGQMHRDRRLGSFVFKKRLQRMTFDERRDQPRACEHLLKVIKGTRLVHNGTASAITDRWIRGRIPLDVTTSTFTPSRSSSS